jgi:hypothetical protein
MFSMQFIWILSIVSIGFCLLLMGKSDQTYQQPNNRKSIIEYRPNKFHADDSSFVAIPETNNSPSMDVFNLNSRWFLEESIVWFNGSTMNWPNPWRIVLLLATNFISTINVILLRLRLRLRLDLNRDHVMVVCCQMYLKNVLLLSLSSDHPSLNDLLLDPRWFNEHDQEHARNSERRILIRLFLHLGKSTSSPSSI